MLQTCQISGMLEYVARLGEILLQLYKGWLLMISEPGLIGVAATPKGSNEF